MSEAPEPYEQMEALDEEIRQAQLRINDLLKRRQVFHRRILTEDMERRRRVIYELNPDDDSGQNP